MIVKELLKKRNVCYSLIGAGLMIIGIAGFALYQVNKVKIEFELKENFIEYGTDLKGFDWMNKAVTNANHISVIELDTKAVGTKLTKFNVCIDDDCKEFEKEIEIKDTKIPEIVLKKESVKFTAGDKFDPLSNVESVKDPVDGDIMRTDDETIKKDGFFIAHDVQAEESGEYKVKVTAFDKNGNKAEKEYNVIVDEKAEEPNENQGANTSPIPNQGGNVETNIPPKTESTSGDNSNAQNSQAPQPSAPVCPNAFYDESMPCNWMPENKTGGFSYYYSEAEADNAGYAYQKEHPNMGFDVLATYDNGGNRVYLVMFWEAE